MEIYNSKDLAEDVKFLKMTVKNLEQQSDLEKKIISLEYSCDTNSNEYRSSKSDDD